MKILLLTQRTLQGYDTYDSVVVAAEDEDTAILINPTEGLIWDEEGGYWYSLGMDGTVYKENRKYAAWPSPSEVTVEYLGLTEHKQGVILASFNAG